MGLEGNSVRLLHVNGGNNLDLHAALVVSPPRATRPRTITSASSIAIRFFILLLLSWYNLADWNWKRFQSLHDISIAHTE